MLSMRRSRGTPTQLGEVLIKPLGALPRSAGAGRDASKPEWRHSSPGSRAAPWAAPGAVRRRCLNPRSGGRTRDAPRYCRICALTSDGIPATKNDPEGIERVADAIAEKAAGILPLRPHRLPHAAGYRTALYRPSGRCARSLCGRPDAPLRRSGRDGRRTSWPPWRGVRARV